MHRLCCIALAVLLPMAAFADEIVTTDDGRQVKVNRDGTWEFVSQDRFATTLSGERVRLRPDGTWAPMVDAPGGTPSTAIAAVAPNEVVGRDEVSLHLKEVTIHKRKIKRAKGDHAELRTHFVVGIKNLDSDVLRVGPDVISRLKAGSNRGADYTVISVVPPTRPIPSGEEGRLEVWAQGAPQWFGTKYLSLEVEAGALGNSVARILSKNMDEIRRIEVDRF